MAWRIIRCMRWHQWGRLIAGLVLADQFIGPLGGIPSDTAIVVVALGAMFAPVPKDKDDGAR